MNSELEIYKYGPFQDQWNLTIYFVLEIINLQVSFSIMHWCLTHVHLNVTRLTSCFLQTLTILYNSILQAYTVDISANKVSMHELL